MKCSRILLIILPLALFFNNSFAQRPDLKFEHFNTRNGLLKNWVWKILQDDKGLMWFATENGLNKFDGYNFSSYQHNPKNRNSLRSNSVRSLYEDREKNLWVGTTEGLHLYDRSKNNFIAFDSLEKSVEVIYEDRFNNFWISTDYGELYLFDRKSKIFSIFLASADTIRGSIGSLSSLFEDSEGTLWYVNEKDIQIVDRINKKVIKMELGLKWASAIFEDSKKILWFSSRHEGLVRYDRHSKQSKHYRHNSENSNSLTDDAVFNITEDHTGKLWIATEHGGLNILDTDRETFYSYLPNSSDPESIGSHSIYTFFCDRNNNIWLGTFNAGASLTKIKKFGHYKNTGGDGIGLNHNNILSFCEDRIGNIWVSTDGGGLNLYDAKTNKFKYFVNDPKNPKSLSNNFVTQVVEDRSGTIWAGFWNGGLDRFDQKKNEFVHYRHDEKNSASLISNNVWKIFEDSEDNLWVGTSHGLDVLDRVTGKFTHFNNSKNGLSNNSILNILEDKDHDIWIATSDGLNLFNKHTKTFTTFMHRVGDPKTISNNTIQSLFNDTKGRLWICTQDGLNLYDKTTHTFTRYAQEIGLTSNSMCSILEDSKHNLWISTQSGISVFNPDTRKVYNYSVDDGLQDNEFKQYAALKTRNGKMLFGGNKGFNMFDPDNIVSNTFIPPVLITDFKIFNKSIENFPGSTLENHISETETITLSYKQSVFSFEFASLNYIASEKNNYSYKMEGFDNDWNFVGATRNATYTNLDPGTYTFRVKGSNNDGVWNNEGAAVKIIIESPYWKTWWFIMMLFFALAGFVYAFIRIRVSVEKNQKAMLEQLVRQQTAEVLEQKEFLIAQAEDMQTLHEHQKEQTKFLQTLNTELEQQRKDAENARHEAESANQTKSIFLATMSHEIRTPMNGVIGMASLLSETSLNNEQLEYTETIKSCGENLLGVINDILDFSKIESGKMEIEEKDFDLRSCIEEVLDIFASKAAPNGVDLMYEMDNNVPSQIIGDSLRIRQVLINLIGNAIKFTHHGEIYVGVHLLSSTSGELKLQFQVRDTGIGIPVDKVNKLFQAFSQVDSSTTRKYGGTGLGLVISEKLIALMGGKVLVASQLGVGTTFSFTLNSKLSKKSIVILEAGLVGKKVLVIDDNATHLNVLKNQLENWKLQPVLVTSGNLALELLAKNSSFDLIITDMLMPDMNGVELAQSIQNLQPSLPIILLNSVGDERGKLHADLFTAILSKPVKQNLLLKSIVKQLQHHHNETLVDESAVQKKLSVEFAQQYPLNILITEDNPVNQKLAQRVLTKLGYEPAQAYNGHEALNALAQKPFDIILMDVQMPEMDGLEATRQIRMRGGIQPRIIAMTANAMQGDREMCLAAGMDDYISKPVKLEGLVDILEKWALRKVNVAERIL